MITDLILGFLLIYISLAILSGIEIILKGKPYSYKKLNLFWLGYRLYKSSFLRKKKMNIPQYVYYIYITKSYNRIFK